MINKHPTANVLIGHQDDVLHQWFLLPPLLERCYQCPYLLGECLFNAAGRPLRVTQSHWAIKCIRILPLTGRRTEVTYRLRLVASEHRGYPPFTYQGLMEFLVVAEEVLDSLGADPSARQQAAHQLVYDGWWSLQSTLSCPTHLRGASDLSTSKWMPWERRHQLWGSVEE